MSKTILVTRAKGDEHEITEGLHTLGHHVIHEPLTEIFLDHTISSHLHALLMTDPNAVIVTSKHAVQALALLSNLRDASLLCVGSATAEMAFSLGFMRVYDAGGTLEHLLQHIQDGYDEDARFVYISGKHIRSDLPVILASFGMQCTHVVAYDAVASEALSDTTMAQLARGQIDAVTFFSPRNAEIFCDLLERAECLEATQVLDAMCLSEDVANSAGKTQWRNIFVATQPTLASLLECVDNAY